MTNAAHEPLEARRKRLIHRSLYTGMKETDILLGGFARARLMDLSVADLDLYESMLATVSDPTIYAWIVGRDEPDPRFAHLIASVRQVNAERLK